MSRVRVKVNRKFLPHLMLLRGALHHLEAAKGNKQGFFYDHLGAILFSALSVEAIGNSYGKVLIPDWEDFESASPIAKLRLVATRCGRKPDFRRHPWTTVKLLIRTRNQIAHAKLEPLKIERDCSLSDYGVAFNARLESKLEKKITAEFAVQSCDAVQQIIDDLNKGLKPSELHELIHDGHESEALAS